MRILALVLIGCSGAGAMDGGQETDAGRDAGRIVRLTLAYRLSVRADGGCAGYSRCDAVAAVSEDVAEFLKTRVAGECGRDAQSFDCFTPAADLCGAGGDGCCSWAPIGASLTECRWNPP